MSSSSARASPPAVGALAAGQPSITPEVGALAARVDALRPESPTSVAAVDEEIDEGMPPLEDQSEDLETSLGRHDVAVISHSVVRNIRCESCQRLVHHALGIATRGFLCASCNSGLRSSDFALAHLEGFGYVHAADANPLNMCFLQSSASPRRLPFAARPQDLVAFPRSTH